MRQGTKRDKIDASRSNCHQTISICTNATRGLDQNMWSKLAYQFNSLAHNLNGHIIQQHHIGTALHSLPYFRKRLTLHLDFEQVRSQSSCSSNSLRDPPCSLDMVIF